MKRLIVSLILFSALWLFGGCGSGGHEAESPRYGSVSFTMNWPANDQGATRAIPESAVQITVVAYRTGVQVGTVTITRPETTGTLEGIREGAVVLTAQAKDDQNATVAWGTATVTVIAFQSVQARLTMQAMTGSINPIDDAEMVWVPGGTFTMGTDFGAWWSAPMTQQVTLSGYWMYKYEVTVAQYREFCAATSRALPSFPSGYSWAGKSGWSDPALQQHPIVNVSWPDAKAYADWAGVSLPTEAQWEYAARGPVGRNYPWGGTATASDPNNGWDPTKCANYYNSSSHGISTWPVGSFPTGMSWCGAQDLAGNVWEWCSDWYGPYSSSPLVNPTSPASGSDRVLRGGSFGISDFEYFFRGAIRYSIVPDFWNGGIGFRCVSVSPGP